MKFSVNHNPYQRKLWYIINIKKFHFWRRKIGNVFETPDCRLAYNHLLPIQFTWPNPKQVCFFNGTLVCAVWKLHSHWHTVFATCLFHECFNKVEVAFTQPNFSWSLKWRIPEDKKIKLGESSYKIQFLIIKLQFHTSISYIYTYINVTYYVYFSSFDNDDMKSSKRPVTFLTFIFVLKMFVLNLPYKNIKGD